MITVILVQHNNGQLTLQAVQTLQQHHTGGHEILIVDNASTDGSLDLVRRSLTGVTVIANPVNEGFGKANNQASLTANGDLLLFLNNDTICIEEYMSALSAAFAEDASLGVLGPRLLNEDRSFQLSAGWVPTFWREIIEKFLYAALRRQVGFVTRSVQRIFSRKRETGWVTGAALSIRKDLFESIGRFDELMFMYYEDKDICARSRRAGKNVVFDPSVSMVHLKGGSSPEALSPFLRDIYRRSQIRYYALHRPRYEQLLLSVYLRVLGSYPHA
jgi:N-acetylglucosaminyl-diphospho-decaprenol L-rhamnosyltransferase